MATPATGMYPRTTIRLQTRLPLLFLAALLAGAIFLPDRVWTTFLIGFGGLYLVAYLWTHTLSRSLRASRRLRFGWVAVGDRLSEEFSLFNSGDLPALWVEILDASNVPGYDISVVRSAPARGSDNWKASAISLRRGQFRLGPWELRSGDPFGLFSVTIAYPGTEEIIVHPPIHGDLPIPLPHGETSGRARARRRALQATINAATVRSYHVRDPLRHIHWPTSARRGQLHVREFDLDAAGDIWLLLDLNAATQLGQGAEGTEEHTILLAAAVAARALAQNRGVGLAAYGRSPTIIPPATGQGQQWKLLRALALIEAQGDVPLAAALNDLGRITQRGSAALIITPSAATDWLPELDNVARHGTQGHVALWDRPSFGGTGSSTAALHAIQQLGYEAAVLQQGEVGRPLAQDDRRGFWEFKVTGMGKVITVRRPEEAPGPRGV